jgi:hypothetical protein
MISPAEVPSIVLGTERDAYANQKLRDQFVDLFGDSIWSKLASDIFFWASPIVRDGQTEGEEYAGLIPMTWPQCSLPLCPINVSRRAILASSQILRSFIQHSPEYCKTIAMRVASNVLSVVSHLPIEIATIRVAGWMSVIKNPVLVSWTVIESLNYIFFMTAGKSCIFFAFLH